MDPQEITPELQVEIKNVRPIELLDLTNSLSALTVEFGEYIAKHHPEVDAADVKLYVHEVRAGSVIATLAALSPTLMQGLSYAVTVGDFAEHLRNGFDWLLGRTEKAGEPSTASNLSQIVEPIAKDAGSQLNIGSLTASNGGVININFSDANTVQNTARRFIDSQRQASSGIQEKVLMHWFQARADSSSKVGDRAIIETISKKPVKTVCATDSLKARMVLSEVNPFQEAFVVDVVVETVNGKPAMYKIIGLHDRFLMD
ncbi:hypothetical protein [Xenophilus sp. Marseille-Q4582]|uniref:hypothetical protein n=1 Tax=Xenophilus sp. Marseille-Q4582 TaxID=2866600 RepID=UPI001CE40CFA|nr:hypothetical protein [Xenophilus sp. Marseille-Q4582]